MSIKEKAKDFWEKHGDAVKVGLVAAGAGILFGVGLKAKSDAANGYVTVTNKQTAAVLVDADRSYPGGHQDYMGRLERPVRASEMGVLGEMMKVPEGHDFEVTHVILTGKMTDNT